MVLKCEEIVQPRYKTSQKYVDCQILIIQVLCICLATPYRRLDVVGRDDDRSVSVKVYLSDR
jgi:hypothetical protein